MTSLRRHLYEYRHHRVPGPARHPQTNAKAGQPVLKLVDQYLLRRIIATSLVMTGVGLAVLLLERLLRLFSLVANPNKAFSFVGQMLVLLTPHYLSVALPAAFFFGVLLTFLRLRQDNELVVLSSVGQGLHRLIAPAMALAVVMTAAAILILGYLNPHARYAYRALKNSVAEASLNAAVREGTFIQADGLTFFAEGSVAGSDGLQLSKVFVYEETSDGDLDRDHGDARPARPDGRGHRHDPEAQGRRARRAARGRRRRQDADLHRSQLAGRRGRGRRVPAARSRSARADPARAVERKTLGRQPAAAPRRSRPSSTPGW